MSKRARIIGASVLGICIIIGAFYFKTTAGSEPLPGIVSVPTDQAAFIAGSDSDGDGISDWEEELEQMTFKMAENAPELTIEEGAPEDTTLTGTFARSFFETYASANVNGVLNEDNQKRFLQASIADLAQQAEDTPYTKKDIVVGGSSAAELRAYGNTIAAIIQTSSVGNTENEIEIFDRALKQQSPEDYRALTNIAGAYTHMLTATLQVAVPQPLTKEHIALLNAYQSVSADTAAMAGAASDPLYALIRLQRYETDIQTLYNAVSSIYLYLYKHGVRYSSDEPASMFEIREQ